VRALRVTDWVRLPAGDDLDFVGPVATSVLRRHGLLHPANAYFHAPLLQEAAGGTLLTGAGGDQVLGRLRRPRRPWWWPNPAAAGPAFGWLRTPAARRVRWGLRREHRARPVRYENRPAWAWGRRDLELTRQSLALLGRDTGTDVVHPLLEPEFLRAICGSGVSPESAGGRAGLLGQVFGGCYPDAVLRLRPKARFGEVFWRHHTRELLAGWSGGGVDPSVVDRARLRLEWDRPQPDLCTAMLVQQVWLATAAPLTAGWPR
jgi:asparagine synthase (glutamine-hydrolysing)